MSEQKLTAEERLDRLEELVVGGLDGLGQMSGRACLRPIWELLEAVRADVKARADG